MAKEVTSTTVTAAPQEEVTTTEAATEAPTEATTTVEITTTVTEPEPTETEPEPTEPEAVVDVIDLKKIPKEEIAGEIYSIARGHGTKLIIEADKIYLFDIKSGELTATSELPELTTQYGLIEPNAFKYLPQVRYLPLVDGYARLYQRQEIIQSGGSVGVLGQAYVSFYDREMNLLKTVALQEWQDYNEIIADVDYVTVTPDGSAIYFVVDKFSEWELRRIDLATAEAKVLYRFESSFFDRNFLYLTEEGNILLAHKDASRESNGEEAMIVVQFSPDGKEIARDSFEKLVDIFPCNDGYGTIVGDKTETVFYLWDPSDGSTTEVARFNNEYRHVHDYGTGSRYPAFWTILRNNNLEVKVLDAIKGETIYEVELGIANVMPFEAGEVLECISYPASGWNILHIPRRTNISPQFIEIPLFED